MNRIISLATGVAVLGLLTTSPMITFAADPAAPPPTIKPISAVSSELQADAAAIAQDRLQISADQKAGRIAAVQKGEHQLYLDVEKQEADRGTGDVREGK
jgi:hypothetical protein